MNILLCRRSLQIFVEKAVGKARGKGQKRGEGSDRKDMPDVEMSSGNIGRGKGYNSRKTSEIMSLKPSSAFIYRQMLLYMWNPNLMKKAEKTRNAEFIIKWERG